LGPRASPRIALSPRDTSIVTAKRERFRIARVFRAAGSGPRRPGDFACLHQHQRGRENTLWALALRRAHPPPKEKRGETPGKKKEKRKKRKKKKAPRMAYTPPSRSLEPWRQYSPRRKSSSHTEYEHTACPRPDIGSGPHPVRDIECASIS